MIGLYSLLEQMNGDIVSSLQWGGGVVLLNDKLDVKLHP